MNTGVNGLVGLSFIKEESVIILKMSLSATSLRQLCQYLERTNQNEKEQETARQSFCSNPHFQLETCFDRMDKFKKGYLIPSDLTEFMLENQIIANEEQIYLVFRDFDLRRRGTVDVEDFAQAMLSRENTKLRKEVGKRKKYEMVARLDSELQFQVGKYFSAKLQGFRTRKALIDESRNNESFSPLRAFDALSGRKGKIEGIEEIDEFLRRNGRVLKNEDCRRILNSLRFGTEGQLTFSNFEDHVDPLRNGFYLGYQAQLAHKIQQKTKYVDTLRARNLLQEERTLNKLEASRLNLQYSSLRSSNLHRSRVIVEQALEREVYEEEAIHNLRMSREIQHESRQIAGLALWRSRMLDDEYLMRNSRLYGL